MANEYRPEIKARYLAIWLDKHDACMRGSLFNVIMRILRYIASHEINLYRDAKGNKRSARELRARCSRRGEREDQARGSKGCVGGGRTGDKADKGWSCLCALRPAELGYIPKQDAENGDFIENVRFDENAFGMREHEIFFDELTRRSPSQDSRLRLMRL